ncbi:hypothetical protein PR048_019046 [Dryococelus australis]|uniref:Uncharacterized protein n=1 Tax=Dryococelus australis TaxID=614101 RepID=A0ABQ9H2Q7_9NEOP|nr:hypothetical protein PR048_019046 [Dryococelus australis]
MIPEESFWIDVRVAGALRFLLSKSSSFCSFSPRQSRKRRVRASDVATKNSKDKHVYLYPLIDVDGLLGDKKANQVRFPAGSLPDFCMWESCRIMRLVSGFSLGSSVSLPLHSGSAPYSHHFTLIGSQNLNNMDIKDSDSDVSDGWSLVDAASQSESGSVKDVSDDNESVNCTASDGESLEIIQEENDERKQFIETEQKKLDGSTLRPMLSLLPNPRGEVVNSHQPPDREIRNGGSLQIMTVPSLWEWAVVIHQIPLWVLDPPLSVPVELVDCRWCHTRWAGDDIEVDCDVVKPSLSRGSEVYIHVTPQPVQTALDVAYHRQRRRSQHVGWPGRRYYTIPDSVKACARSIIAAVIRASVALVMAFSAMYGQISYQVRADRHAARLTVSGLGSMGVLTRQGHEASLSFHSSELLQGYQLAAHYCCCTHPVSLLLSKATGPDVDLSHHQLPYSILYRSVVALYMTLDQPDHNMIMLISFSSIGVSDVDNDCFSVISNCSSMIEDAASDNIEWNTSKLQTYVHRRNCLLNARLNFVLVVAVAAVAGLGVGHFIGEFCFFLTHFGSVNGTWNVDYALDPDNPHHSLHLLQCYRKNGWPFPWTHLDTRMTVSLCKVRAVTKAKGGPRINAHCWAVYPRDTCRTVLHGCPDIFDQIV